MSMQGFGGSGGDFQGFEDLDRDGDPGYDDLIDREAGQWRAERAYDAEQADGDAPVAGNIYPEVADEIAGNPAEVSRAARRVAAANAVADSVVPGAVVAAPVLATAASAVTPVTTVQAPVYADQPGFVAAPVTVAPVAAGAQSVAMTRQLGGNFTANAAARRRGMSVTSEGRRPSVLTYIFLTLVLLISIFPLYYALSIASQPTTVTQYGPQALVIRGGLLNNLRTAFEEIGFWRALLGTFIVSASCAISVVMFSTLAGFSFAKLNYKGRSTLLFLVVATMAIPTQLAVVPLYLMMSKATNLIPGNPNGLFGSLWAVVIPGLVTAFGVFWMTQYLEGALPYELVEAARMDGASMFRTFWSVALPAARPAAAMLFLFTFVAQWTNYYWPMLILGQNNKAVLTVAAATLRGARFTDYTLIMAGVLLVSLPLLIVFVFAGKQLVSGIMAGAVKG